MSVVLITLTSTAPSATDLGFLLHKHPDRVQRFELPVGTAHVFYPEATAARCTVALLLEVDPVGLVRDKRFKGNGFAPSRYVNDRPYVASSMMAVALGEVFRTALRGRCAARPDLEGTALPLTIHLPAVPAPDGPAMIGQLFGPLGWQVDAVVSPLDPEVPKWGAASHLDLTLTGSLTVSDALSQLYVLLPVLDGSKHYWVGTDEVDKLVRNGGTWLHAHPEREWITRRYLAHQRDLVEDATERLATLEDQSTEGTTGAALLPLTQQPLTQQPLTQQPLTQQPLTQQPLTQPPSTRPRLAHQRVSAVMAALTEVNARRVVDLGCGEGALIAALLADPSFTEVMGVDVADRELRRATTRLGLDRMSDHQRARLTLRQSSLSYRDTAIAGFDAAVLMEVIEHVDPTRLPTVQNTVFGQARPRVVVVTTPNADYNPLYQHLPRGAFRHPDHRFEWSRREFGAWAEKVAGQFGYRVSLRSVGDPDAQLGAPTQLALFTRIIGSMGETE